MGSGDIGPALGRRFVLLVVLGAVLPLALIGWVTTRSAARSGRSLLRSQLEAQLAQSVAEVEVRWQHHRSNLLMLGENEPVRVQLLGDAPTDGEAPPFARRAFAEMPALGRVVLRDRQGNERWRLETAALPATGVDPRDTPDLRGIPVRVAVTDLLTGDTIGELEASVRVASLVPEVTSEASATGPVMAASTRDGLLIAPSGVNERIFAAENVEWAEHRWLALRRSLGDPPIDVVIAGALDPYVGPFERAAGRGALALLAGASIVAVAIVLLTRRLTREVERELAHREALAAVGEFASELAHEVRNPLTAIRLDLQRVEEVATEPDAVRGIVPRVLRQIDRLDRAVTGALRVARGGSIEPKAVDLREILESARRAAAPEFDRRGATLLLSVSSPIRVEGDAGALEQLFLNLLINAAQALAPGGEARVEAAQRNGTADVLITDNGSGMTPAQLEHVQRGYRSSRRDGTGLGLKIARRIAATHGGALEMRSDLGVGTSVRVRIPALPAASGGAV